MKIAVVDYGSGNLASAQRALQLAAGRLGLDADVAITGDPDDVDAADRIVVPGQGAFADCARGMRAVPGLEAAVLRGADAKPFLGICVGMQLMAARGLEHQVTAGWGWVRGDIAPMTPPPEYRLPQMGWNGLDFVPGAHPLLDGLLPDDHVYFVHSYSLSGGDPAQCIATTDYGGRVVAMVADRNRAGTQFHVEKSQEVGLRILANFLRWDPI